ncbi:MAG: UDP-GlcNAc--UDP-phosphate GlcNAc-1-phosphate transferase [Muribaculaceae bacterium]|nr:UDP-GlcNAc--UDP-phosphate GlcNAc-1-phosphate transferase [Muribaculaceae bacterium]
MELGYLRLAERFRIVASENCCDPRHFNTPTAGGVIFIAAVLLYTVFYTPPYPWFLIGILVIGAVSFMDDIHSLPISMRLITQFIATSLILLQLMPLLYPVWWIVILSLIIGVGIINAFNFMDGIDGITACYSLAVLVPLWYINSSTHFISEEFLIVASLGVLVFLFFNFRSLSRCFAGDVGAVSIAYIIVFAIAALIIKTGNFAYLTLIAVYGADTVLTIIHRIVLRENIGQRHSKHIYQLLVYVLHIPHRLVAAGYMALQLLVSCGMLFLPVNGYIYMAVWCVLLTLTYIILLKRFYPSDKRNSE